MICLAVATFSLSLMTRAGSMREHDTPSKAEQSATVASTQPPRQCRWIARLEANSSGETNRPARASGSAAARPGRSTPAAKHQDDDVGATSECEANHDSDRRRSRVGRQARDDRGEQQRECARTREHARGATAKRRAHVVGERSRLREIAVYCSSAKSGVVRSAGEASRTKGNGIDVDSCRSCRKM